MLNKFRESAVARWLARAVLAGLSAGVLSLQAADQPLSRAALIAALAAVSQAVVEYFSPLAQLIGRR